MKNFKISEDVEELKNLYLSASNYEVMNAIDNVREVFYDFCLGRVLYSDVIQSIKDVEEILE